MPDPPPVIVRRDWYYKTMSTIEHRKGNLLAADAEALVNTVNTVGVMGKGIALQFRKAFPDNYRAYQRAAGTTSSSRGACSSSRRPG